MTRLYHMLSFRLLSLFFVPFAVLCLSVSAQELTLPDEARLNRLEKALGERDTISDSQRASLTELIEEARGFLASTDPEDSKQKLRELTERLSSAPALLEETESRITELSDSAPKAIPLPRQQQKLEELLQRLKGEIDQLARQRQEAETQLSLLPSQQKSMVERLASTRSQLGELEQILATLTSSELPVQIRRAKLLLERQSTKQTELRLEKQIDLLEVQGKLLPEQLRLFELQLSRLETQRDAASEAFRALVDQTVDQQRERFAELLRGAPVAIPEVRKLSDSAEYLANLRFGEESVATEVSRVEEDLRDTEEQLQYLSRTFRELRRRFALFGSNKSMAPLLRSFFKELPSQTNLEGALRREQEQLVEHELTLFQLQELSRESKQFSLDESEFVSLTENQRGAVNELFQVHEKLLRELLAEFPRLTSASFERIAVGEQLRELTREATVFIRDRILWIPGPGLLRSFDAGQLSAALMWITDSPSWERLLTPQSFESFVFLALALLTFSVFQASRRKLASFEAENSRAVSRFATDSVRLTLIGVFVHIIRAVRFSAVVFLLGLFCVRGAAIASPAHELGNALLSFTPYLFSLLFLRDVLSAGGVGVKHFRWPENVCREIRANLTWFIPLAAIGVVLIQLVANQYDAAWYGAAVAFLVPFFIALLLVFMRFTTGPKCCLRNHLVALDNSSFSVRSNRIWRRLLYYSPVLLLGLSVFGYQLAALTLSIEYLETLIFIGYVFVFSEVLRRWLLIARRRALLQQRRAEREARIAQQRLQQDSEIPVEPEHIDEDKIDIPKLDAQTRVLFRASVSTLLFLGLLFIWADELPAIRILERIQVYPSVAVLSADYVEERAAIGASQPENYSLPSLPVAGLLQSSESASADETTEPAVALERFVTLYDVLFALFVLTLVLVAVRNLPALIEIAALQRLHLDPGVRYAANALVRYTVMLAGLSLSLSVLGIEWAKIQWLAAALTFGLAFGLQEIFANFISGIIVLFEQPIRVGDTVTIGSTTGRVTKIRMRATTILDWDRKELVIPNKEFVTGQIINWSLSDSVLRIICPVGVAYGSDTKLVTKLLYQIASEHPKLLTEPAPRVLFRSFGDSTLDFELRAFISNVDDLFIVKHEVLLKVDDLFHEHGIEIAFPQRDLHIRSSDISFKVEKAESAKAIVHAGDS